jgi:phosphoglucomutase
MDKAIVEKVNIWLEGNYDADTKSEIRRLMREDEEALVESFYKTLEFGTGGLRGIMGVGTNRMNRYTVGTATQGLANYMLNVFQDKSSLRLAVAYDSRNNNRFFADTVADVLSANGIQVYVFDDIRPTPELSFAVRHLGCQAGIVITASHNPPEYNGYKVYWEDGGQLVPPHDKNVIEEVNKIQSIDEVKFDRNDLLVKSIGAEVDEAYMQTITRLSLSPEAIREYGDMKIVYTPIHGTGVKLVPDTLRKMGFQNIINVPEQDIPDGNFPTVKSPNPEETAALQMAIDKAKETQAEIVLATDPDADRIGLAVRTGEGEYELFNGNQTASLLIYYLLTRWKENNMLSGMEFIVKTIVTTELLREIAEAFDVEIIDTLTGFKYIAEQIRLWEGKKRFVGGGEESYGYLVGDAVRDKDAVVSAVMIAEMTVWAKQQGKSLKNLLAEIYSKHHFYRERLVSVVRKGIKGAEEIQEMMKSYRQTPPKEVFGEKLVMVKDFLSRKSLNTITGEESEIDLPASNVLQFFLSGGSKISIRPSGTEPKIKFYFSVREKLTTINEYTRTEKYLDEKLNKIIAEIVR